VTKRRVDITRTDAPASRRRDLPVLLAILVIGLVLRTGYQRELANTPDYARPLADAAFHDYWARALVTGNWTRPAGNTDPQIPTTPYLRPPGYPYFLALVYRLAGPGNYLAVRIVQMGLGLLSALLAYWLGRAVLGRGAGLLAAMFLCTHWAFIYYEGELQEPGLLVLLALFIALVLHAWARRPAVWRAALAGLLLGVFALLRANILLFVPVALAWIGWVLWRRGERRRVLASALGLVFGVALPIVPVTVRNYLVAHDFVLISGNGAINLYIGNNERSDGYTARLPDLYELSGENTWSWFNYGKIVRGVEAELGRPLKQSDVAAYFRNKALKYMRDNPLRCLGLAAKRVLLFWGPAEVANNKEVHFERRFSHWLWWLPGFPLATATAALGLIVLWRDRRGPQPAKGPAAAVQLDSVVLILLFILVWFASFIPFLVAERFRVPIAPFLGLFGAYAVYRLGCWAATRDWRRLAGWGLAGAALLAVAEIHWVHYEPQLSGWHMGRGDAYAWLEQWDQAIAEYSAAVEVKPTYLVARKVLAVALYHQGRREEALQQYRKMLELTPDDPDLLTDVGGMLLNLNRPAEAEEAFSQALRLKPGVASVHVNRAVALLRQGQLDRAVDECRAALRIEPELAVAHYNLGLALAAQGASEEAAVAYRAAVDADPGYAEARINLGTLLAKKGQLDAAIDEYRQVLARDPNHFEALYNLASALATQGHPDQASAALKRALEIRPDSAPARRALQALQKQHSGSPGD
jgi:tetratricopeptide (TPR) repeat protein